MGEMTVKRYQVSKFFQFTLILVATGLMLMFLYLVEIVRYHLPKELTEFNADLMRQGSYVTITSGALAPQGDRNSTAFFLTFAQEYQLYYLLLGESKEVPVLVSNKNLITKLESWRNGQGMGDTVSMIARVEKIDGKTYFWQVTKEEVRQSHGILSFVGGIVLCAGLLLFATIGGFRVVYEKPFEDSKRYKDIFLGRSYRMEEELKRERELLERYRKEQADMKKWFQLGFGMTVGCILGMLFCALLFKGFSMTSNPILYALGVILLFVFFYVLLIGIKFIWMAYINSDWPSARRISELFLLRTLSVKKEETSKLINLLSRKVKEAEELAKEKGEENIRMWYGPGVWEEKEGDTDHEGDAVK